jgi:hypothetical protein
VSVRRCWPESYATLQTSSWLRLVCERETSAQELNATRAAEQKGWRCILRELFSAGGETVWMELPFFCDYGSNIELGERVFFQLQLHHPRRLPGAHRQFHPLWSGSAHAKAFNASVKGWYFLAGGDSDRRVDATFRLRRSPDKDGEINRILRYFLVSPTAREIVDHTHRVDPRKPARDAEEATSGTLE